MIGAKSTPMRKIASRVSAVALCAIALISCSDSQQRTTANTAVFNAKMAELGDFNKMRAFMSNTTSRSSFPAHGNQVWYLSPNGKAFLWYPGNSSVLKGEWKVGIAGVTTADTGVTVSLPSVCFRYPSSSRNPVTREQGGSWECNATVAYFIGINEMRKGDVLNLTEDIPFKLERRPELTLSELAISAGLSAPNTPNIATWRSRAASN